jgi:hypothetical protein
VRVRRVENCILRVGWLMNLLGRLLIIEVVGVWRERELDRFDARIAVWLLGQGSRDGRFYIQIVWWRLHFVATAEIQAPRTG